MKFSISNSFIQAADRLHQSRSQFDDRKFDSNKRIGRPPVVLKMTLL